MSWAAVIAGGAALIGGVVANQGAKKASNTAAASSDAAIAEQRRQFDTLLGLTAPQRAIGNQALNALGAVYGYSPAASNALIPAGATPYAGGASGGRNLIGTARELLGPKNAALGLISPSAQLFSSAGILGGLFGNKHGDEKRNLNAFLSENEVYDLGDGMLALADGTTFRQSQLQDVAGAWYGATYAPDGDQEGWQQRYSALIQRPENTSGRTYEYMPDGSIREVMSVGPQQATAPQRPDYRNFFASPDYQFRLDEGLSAVQNSAAARGGLYSGNALRGIEEYGQGLAAGEFGNWFNRQAALAGIGQTATNQAAQGALATGANVGNLLIGQGNARASGIVDQTNALTGTINQLALLAGSGAFGGWGGFKPNSRMTTGYGIPYGGALA